MKISIYKLRKIGAKHKWRTKKDSKNRLLVGPVANRKVRRINIAIFRAKQFEWDFIKSRKNRVKVLKPYMQG